MRATVVSSMRNEGPFIVEWLCWYRMLGFCDAVVVTNNCTDRSPELLDALQAAGWVHHIRHDVAPGLPITPAKLKAAKAHPAVRAADWVMVCDVDEFLVIHRGAGRLEDLLAGADYLGMSINWRVFGSDGRRAFAEGPVHRQFFGAVGLTCGLSRWIKSIHRHSDWFRELGEHGPKGLIRARSGQDWGAPSMVWVNAAGAPVPEWVPGGAYLRMLAPERASHAAAQINHYMLRSAESFSLKAGTLSPVAQKDRYNADYRARADRADDIDNSALRHAARFDAVFADAMALPDVRRLHLLCSADHLQLIAEKAGRRIEADPRYQDYLARAG